MEDGIGVDRGDGGKVGVAGGANEDGHIHCPGAWRRKAEPVFAWRNEAHEKAPAEGPGLLSTIDGSSDQLLRLPKSASRIWNMLMKSR